MKVRLNQVTRYGEESSFGGERTADSRKLPRFPRSLDSVWRGMEVACFSGSQCYKMSKIEP